jgi:hypothetical protein
LSNLGISAPIQNSIEEHPQAILMNNYYELARDSVLEAHDWTFANATKELSIAEESSINGNWQFCFTLPNDCISPRAVVDMFDKKEKKYEPGIDSAGQKVIYTNTNPCLLKYTKRVTNETFYTARFVNALAFYLAYLSAQVITGSNNKKNTNLQDYQIAIREAIVLDARKTENKDQDDKDYTDAR